MGKPKGDDGDIRKMLNQEQQLAANLTRANAKIAAEGLRVDQNIKREKRRKDGKPPKGKEELYSAKQVSRQLSSKDAAKTQERTKDVRKFLHSAARNYLSGLVNPWAQEVYKNPVNYNPVPTLRSMFARTTFTRTSIPVVVNTCTAIHLLPGHGEEISMDGVAYHAKPQTIGALGAARFSASPMDDVFGFYGNIYGAAGCMTSGLATGAVSTAANEATAACTALLWDVKLPFTSDGTTKGAHTRWKLLSAGIKIVNVTNALNKGGNIVTVQPAYRGFIQQGSVAYSQAQLAEDPSYRDHGSDRATVTWIPRMTDLSYWHTSALVGESLFSGPETAIAVYLNAGAAQQQYAIEIVYNWEIAGVNTMPLQSTSVSVPDAASTINPTITVLHAGATTAAKAVEVADAVAASQHPEGESVARQIWSKAGTALGALVMETAGLIL